MEQAIKDFEISPNILNSNTIVVGVMSFFLSIALLTLALPIAETSGTSEKIPFQVFIIIIIFFLVIIFILTISTSIGRKIDIQDRLLFFRKRAYFGFGKWNIEKIFDFTRIKIIRDRNEMRIAYGGKFIVPYRVYWIVFEMTDGTKQEIFFSGWDKTSLKHLFYFIKGKFPHILFNNFILKDSSEKLSGLHEYLNPKNGNL